MRSVLEEYGVLFYDILAGTSVIAGLEIVLEWIIG